MVDYEGTARRASRIITFADRLHHASGRHWSKYPTIARRLVPRSDFVRLGSYDYAMGEVDLGDGEFDLEDARDLVLTWLEVSPPELPAELQTRGSATLQLRWELASLRSSDDPKQALHNPGCSRGLKPPLSRSDLAM